RSTVPWARRYGARFLPGALGPTSLRRPSHPSRAREDLMFGRSLALRVASALAVAALLASSTLASGAGPQAPSFRSPVRLGFPLGDDWEPSIAADRFGHVYAFWTHFVGYPGAATGEVD